MPKGAELIAAERERQITIEGYTPKSDDRVIHGIGDIAVAAACYAIPSYIRDVTPLGDKTRPIISWLWPWRKELWKPTPNDRIKELTKAGALLAAEIDRLIRAREREVSNV